MKSILFAIAFLISIPYLHAQQKKPITVRINTPSVQCEKCKKAIEDYLKFEEGILNSNVDYKQKFVKVTYLGDRTNLENIKTAIANAGYDAEEVKADPDAYAQLPKCCKKPSK